MKFKYFEINWRGFRIHKFAIGFRLGYHTTTGKLAGFYIWVDWRGDVSRTWR